MPAPDPFVERVIALLTPLGPVEARRMFGGYGLYLEGTIFALVFDGALYLKADEQTKGAFERHGCGPMTYEGGRGQEIALPYWETPKKLLKDGKALCRWARKAYAAGLRFNAKKKPIPAKPRPGKGAAERVPARKLPRRPRYEPDF